MAIVRLYTGDDGESHFEELELAAHPELSTVQENKGISFRSTAAGNFQDWHHAPRRQYVITLTGEMEIGVGDGTLRHFGPGDVLLAQDLTGRGHTTRIVGNQPRTSATIPLE